MPRLPLAIAFSLFASLVPTRAPAADAPDFSRDVRPILSKHCFKCHGPDDKARKAKLRLDDRQAALRGGESGEKAVVPGKPDESELIRRIFANDESERMPPAATKNPLSDRDKQTLRTWIVAGAESLAGKSFKDGRQALPAGVEFPEGNPESHGKRWLEKHFPGYRPTRDQGALTDLIDFNVVRAKNLRSFTRLEHAIDQLLEAAGTGTFISTPG